jgi:hypothetical protein
MATDDTKRAAQEFLAVRMSEETVQQEEAVNREAAARLAPQVWKRVADTFNSQCKAWNEILHEEALTCKDTIRGDLRIRCAGKPHQISVHYDSRKLQVTIKNSARPENEKDSVFFIQGWASGAEAHLFRNNQPVNLEAIVLGELRVLAGIGRTAAQ